MVSQCDERERKLKRGKAADNNGVMLKSFFLFFSRLEDRSRASSSELVWAWKLKSFDFYEFCVYKSHTTENMRLTLQWFKSQWSRKVLKIYEIWLIYGTHETEIVPKVRFLLFHLGWRRRRERRKRERDRGNYVEWEVDHGRFSFNVTFGSGWFSTLFLLLNLTTSFLSQRCHFFNFISIKINEFFFFSFNK